MNRVAENLWEVERPLKVPLVRINHRMSVARLRNGELWVHSPVEYGPNLAAALAELGAVKHLVAPSRLHDLYWPSWFAAYPNATFYCSPGMKEDHPDWPFTRVLAADVQESWEQELLKHLVPGMPRVNEFVFFHVASSTLIVADLLFNLSAADQNLFGKIFLKLYGIHNRVSVSRLFRSLTKDRRAFRACMDDLMRHDFRRIIPGHGGVIESDGVRIFEQAIKRARL